MLNIYTQLERFEFDSSGLAIEWQFIKSTDSKINYISEYLN